jgi:hypothetical protein
MRDVRSQVWYHDGLVCYRRGAPRLAERHVARCARLHRLLAETFHPAPNAGNCRQAVGNLGGRERSVPPLHSKKSARRRILSIGV